MSYTPGMTAAVCGSESLELSATADKKVQVSDSLVLASRDSNLYESCAWLIKPPADTFRDGAYINIWVTSLTKANFYIYEGTDRHNATAVISLNATAVLGAPYRVPASSGVIVVMQTIGSQLSGSGQFSYQTIGVQYDWYESPYIG